MDTILKWKSLSTLLTYFHIMDRFKDGCHDCHVVELYRYNSQSVIRIIGSIIRTIAVISIGRNNRHGRPQVGLSKVAK